MLRLTAKGKIVPKSSAEIVHSKIGIGFEKLDRDVFDPEKAYDHVAKCGVKWARLQSGWQRTERKEGVYDFTWLDKIVDTFIQRKIEPWLCLCYGNDLYTESAKKYFGAVGCVPNGSEREKQAWHDYVVATVEHYKGRVHYYEVWNEPDGAWCWKHGPNPKELAEFTIDTAKACKEADPDCEVLGLVLCNSKKEFLDGLKATAVLDYLDGVTYHAYVVEEQEWAARIHVYKDWFKEAGKENLKLIQGESGTQSRYSHAGALREACWTQEKQAKFLLRHLLTDLKEGVYFTSYFSSMDMIEALNGLNGDVSSYLDYGYFGVLGADFDENGKSVGTYTPKPSYYALQNLCSVLSEEYEITEAFAEGVIRPSIYVRGEDYDFGKTASLSIRKPNGSSALLYWVPCNVLTETYEGTVSVKLLPEMQGKELKLVDLLSGLVYELLPEMVDGDELINIPVSDSPYMITAGDFCDWNLQ